MTANTNTHQEAGGSRWIVLTAAALFAAFAWYYALGAGYLPRGAGPDSAAHHDIARFIYTNKRLAVIPEDQDQLLFTPYGTSRALRPPLSYIVSAVVARMVYQPDRDRFKLLRLGSGVLCALTVAITFSAIWLLFGRYWLALIAALLFGLLPQLAFIGIYTNDDSSAIFSASLLVLAVVLVHRNGFRMGTGLLLAASLGAVVLSKFTAWLAAPILLAFILPELWCRRRKLPTHAPLMLVVFILGGGWWIGFNVAHYGLDDPLLLKTSREVAASHGRIPTPDSRGFASHGVSAYQLIIGNHKNFIGESYKATIGNLDWLRLRVGWLQYGVYLFVIVCALLYVPFRAISRFARPPPAASAPARLYWSLFLAVIFQVFMYVYFNLYHDIQIQGKYMLPVLLPVLILFCAAMLGAHKVLQGVLEYLKFPDAEKKLVTLVLCVAALAMVIGSHAHAVKTYFLPFYFPPPLRYDIKAFREVALGDAGLVRQSHMADHAYSTDGLVVRTSGNDPQLFLDPSLCALFATNTLVQIDLTADSPGDFKIYIDDGSGFNEANSSGLGYVAGHNRLVLAIGVAGCRNVRLDPRSTPGTLTIHRLAMAPFKVSRH